MTDSRSKIALIVFTREGPALEGGGRGITYQFLQGLAADFPQLEMCDLYALFDEHLVPLRSGEDAHQAINVPRRSRFNELPKWVGRPPKIVLQSLMVQRLAAQYQGTVVLAYTHFHAGQLISRNRVFVIHTEHTKGGMHTEHLVIKRRRDMQYRLLRFLCDQAIRRADRVVFPSRSAADLYEFHNPDADFRDKCSIIYNGIQDPLDGHASSGEPSASNEVTILNIAQHVPEKGLDLVMQGLGLWKARTSVRRGVHFINCGGLTSETPRVQDLANRFGIRDMCEFAGWTPRERVLELLASADVFALTPQVAVFDLALLEAMALSKPIISTPVGGNLEALGENYWGYVRTPQDFAEKLDALLSDSAFAATLGAQNRRRFLGRFHLRSMMEGYLALLKQSSEFLRNTVMADARS